jgi:hypothetical protein
VNPPNIKKREQTKQIKKGFFAGRMRKRFARAKKKKNGRSKLNFDGTTFIKTHLRQENILYENQPMWNGIQHMVRPRVSYYLIQHRVGILCTT